MTLEKSEEEEERVVEEGEEDLKIQGSCKRSNTIMKFVMDVLEFHPRFKRRMRQGFCDILYRGGMNSRDMQLTGARGRPSVQSLPP